MRSAGPLALVVSSAIATLLTFTPTFASADPSTAECLEANESSIARKKEKKLRDARTALLVCASQTCPQEIREECEKRMTEIISAVPSLVFVAKLGATGADVVDVVVTMDGQPFLARLDGSAVEVDPGAHAFSFEMAGQPKIEQQIVVREGEKNRRETITFGAPPAKKEIAPTPTPPTGESSSFGPFQIGGLAAGGVGVIGLGVGAFLGLDAKSKRDASGCTDRVCPDSSSATSLRKAADTAGLATIFFVVGGVLAAGGAALFFFGPHPTANAPPANPPPTAAFGFDFVPSRTGSSDATPSGGVVNYSGAF